VNIVKKHKRATNPKRRAAHRATAPIARRRYAARPQTGEPTRVRGARQGRHGAADRGEVRPADTARESGNSMADTKEQDPKAGRRLTRGSTSGQEPKAADVAPRRPRRAQPSRDKQKKQKGKGRLRAASSGGAEGRHWTRRPPPRLPRYYAHGVRPKLAQQFASRIPTRSRAVKIVLTWDGDASRTQGARVAVPSSAPSPPAARVTRAGKPSPFQLARGYAGRCSVTLRARGCRV